MVMLIATIISAVILATGLPSRPSAHVWDRLTAGFPTLRQASPYARYTFAAFLSAIVFVLPAASLGIISIADTSPLGIILGSLLHVMQMFVLGCNNDLTGTGAIDTFGLLVGSVVSSWNAILFVALPTATIVDVLSLLHDFLDELRIGLTNRDLIIFSGLNSKTVAIASTINETSCGSSRQPLVVFANTNESEADVNLLERATLGGAKCISESASACLARTTRHARDGNERRFQIYLLGENETANLSEASQVVEQLVQSMDRGIAYGESWIFVGSSSHAGEALVDSLSVSLHGAQSIVNNNHYSMHIRRIDWAQRTVDTILTKYPLFLTNTNQLQTSTKGASMGFAQCDQLYRTRARHIAIVGNSKLAAVFLRSAIWASQLSGGDSYPINCQIDVLTDSKQAALMDGLLFNAPGLLDEHGRLRYGIHECHMALKSTEYLDYLLANNDLTYILIAGEDDLENINFAIRTRETLERARAELGKRVSSSPILLTAIHDNGLSDTFNEALDANTNLDTNSIITVGKVDDIYSYRELINPRLEDIAHNVHLAYCGLITSCPEKGIITSHQAEYQYETSEYNRRSSRASALFLKYMVFSFICTAWRNESAQKDESADQNSPSALANLIPKINWSAELGEPNSYLGQAVEAFDVYIQRRTPTEREWISRMEHERWRAYMNVEGWLGAGKISSVHTLTNAITTKTSVQSYIHA